MGNGMQWITSNVIGGSSDASVNIWASAVMLIIIIALAAYLIYLHRKRQQRAG